MNSAAEVIVEWHVMQMIIQPMNVDERYMPVAHTCFNLLDLPSYSNREILRRKLLHAIEHTHGFALVWYQHSDFIR